MSVVTAFIGTTPLKTGTFDEKQYQHQAIARTIRDRCTILAHFSCNVVAARCFHGNFLAVTTWRKTMCRLMNGRSGPICKSTSYGNVAVVVSRWCDCYIEPSRLSLKRKRSSRMAVSCLFSSLPSAATRYYKLQHMWVWMSLRCQRCKCKNLIWLMATTTIQKSSSCNSLLFSRNELICFCTWRMYKLESVQLGNSQTKIWTWPVSYGSIHSDPSFNYVDLVLHRLYLDKFPTRATHLVRRPANVEVANLTFAKRIYPSKDNEPVNPIGNLNFDTSGILVATSKSKKSNETPGKFHFLHLYFHDATTLG